MEPEEPRIAIRTDIGVSHIVITQAQDMDAVIAFWNDSKDDFQNIATKYANGIRWYAAEGLNQ